ncbi:MFS transporter [candidate division KSB1 bacterium]
MKIGSGKIITRTVLLVSFVSFFNDIASEMLYPVMPVFLKSIGFSVLLIGILEGVAEATAGISKGYFGNLSDSIGKRLPFIQLGYLLSAVSKPLLAVTVYPLWIFFVRTTDRLGKGVRTSARDALLSDETTSKHKGKVFGFHRGMDTLGAATGPILALIFLYFYPAKYVWLFLIAFLPGIVAVSLTLFIKEKKKDKTDIKKKIGFLAYFTYWKKSTVNYKVLVVGLLGFVLFNSSDAFLLLGLKEYGYTDTQMIAFYIFYNLVFALLAYPIGILADKVGLERMLISGLILFGIVYISMGLAFTLFHFILIFFLYGAYAASTDGVSKALISNIAKKEDTATALGFYNSLASILTLISSMLAGIIWHFMGFKAMFFFSGAGVILVVFYFFIINRWIRN